MKKHTLAVDIGSGVTKWAYKDDTETHVGRCLSVTGILREEDLKHFGVNNYKKVEFDGQIWLAGDAAEATLPPARRSDTLSSSWGGSDGWMALLYYAIGSAFTDGGNYSLMLTTGLPQAMYADSEKDLVERISGEHKFTFGGVEHIVDIRVMVIPQALAALLHHAKEDAGLLTGTTGDIDVGTYTTGFAVLRKGNMQTWRCGGQEVGVHSLINSLIKHLKSEYSMHVDPATAHDILLNRSVNYRGQEISLDNIIEELSFAEATPLINVITQAWQGGGDIQRVIINGGGAPLFYSALKRAVPHAELGEQPGDAVVRGLLAYA